MNSFLKRLCPRFLLFEISDATIFQLLVVFWGIGSCNIKYCYDLLFYIFSDYIIKNSINIWFKLVVCNSINTLWLMFVKLWFRLSIREPTVFSVWCFFEGLIITQLYQIALSNSDFKIQFFTLLRYFSFHACLV